MTFFNSFFDSQAGSGGTTSETTAGFSTVPQEERPSTSLLHPKVFPQPSEEQRERHMENSYKDGPVKDYVEWLENVKKNAGGNVWNVPSENLEELMEDSEKQVEEYLFYERNLQFFYWDCVRARHVRHYLNSSQLPAGTDESTMIQYLMLIWNTQQDLLPEDLKKSVKEALEGAANPLEPLLTFLSNHHEVQHINEISAELLALLQEIVSADAIQCSPEIRPRMVALFEEVQLKKWLSEFFAEKLSWFNDEDVRRVLSDPSIYGLTPNQIAELRKCLN